MRRIKEYWDNLIQKYDIHLGFAPVGSSSRFLAHIDEDYDSIRFLVDGVGMQAQGLMMMPGQTVNNLQNNLPEPVEVPEYRGGNFKISIATKCPHGICLHFRPRSLRFIESIPEGDPNPLEFLFEKLGFIDIFENYDPSKIAKQVLTGLIFQSLKKNKETIKRKVVESRKAIESSLRRIDKLHAEISDLSQTISRYDDVKNIETMVNDYDCLIDSMSSGIRFEGNNIVVKMNKFETDVYPLQSERDQKIDLGPYVIKYNMANQTVSVDPVRNETHMSHCGLWHPQIDRGGFICWGDGARQYSDICNRGNPLELIFFTMQFLKTAYNPHDSYGKLHHWSEPPGWYCNRCNEEHPRNSRCPRERYCAIHDHHWFPEDQRVQINTGQGGNHCPHCVRDGMEALQGFLESAHEIAVQKKRKEHAAAIAVGEFIREAVLFNKIKEQRELQRKLDEGMFEVLKSLERFLCPIEDESVIAALDDEMELAKFMRLAPQNGQAEAL